MKHLFLCSLFFLWALFPHTGLATSVDPVSSDSQAAPPIDDTYTLSHDKAAQSWSFQSPVEKWATSIFGDGKEQTSTTPFVEPEENPQARPNLPMDLFLPAGVTVDPTFSEP